MLIVFLLLLVTRLTLARQQPNILFILGDDIGWNDIGYAEDRDSYRSTSPVPLTPNLDRLAKNGIKFNENYVLPTCSPSRTALLTGKYPYTMGIHAIIQENQPTGLPLDQKLLPSYMKELGYQADAVGKWHLGFCKWAYTPTRRGFDSFLGYFGGGEYYYQHNQIINSLGRRMDGYDYWEDEEIYRSDTYSTYDFANRTIQLIYKAKRNKVPFFIYLAFQAAHVPLELPDEYIQFYKDYDTSPMRIRFMGIMTAMDDQIGRILTVLKETGLLEDTILAFSSDNGGMPSRGGNNQPLRGTKNTLWEGGTRVPAFISGAKVPAGRTYDGFFHIVDWLPTLVAIAGGRLPEYEFDGINHWPAIQQNAESPRTEFIYQINGVAQKAAIRLGDYKLIIGNPGNHNDWYWNQTVETHMFTRRSEDKHLYNIAHDPLERFNLTDKKPKIVDYLFQRLEEYKQRMVTPIVVKPVRRADPRFHNGVWRPGWC